MGVNTRKKMTSDLVKHLENQRQALVASRERQSDKGTPKAQAGKGKK